MLQDATQENIQIYKEARNIANSTMRRQKRLIERRAIDDIEKYKNNPRLFFKQIKSIKEGYKAQSCIMTDHGGNLITETQSILNLF